MCTSYGGSTGRAGAAAVHAAIHFGNLGPHALLEVVFWERGMYVWLPRACVAGACADVSQQQLHMQKPVITSVANALTQLRLVLLLPRSIV